MYIDGKTIFVAGAAGLAGSAVVQALLNASPTVRIRGGYRSSAGHFLDDNRLAYEQGDLRNADDCARLVQNCDAAVLTAATTGGARQAAEEPWRLITDNVVIDARLIEAVCLAGIRRIIYVSSATVYQEYDGFIREDQLDWNADPVLSYLGTGWVNRYAEKLWQFWHKQAGVEFLIARASNIFGPYSKFNLHTANFIPALIRKAASGMDPFEVWGSPDITRDVIFSDDFGAAIVAMLNAVDVKFDAFNVGSNRRTRVGEVAEWALHYTGHQPREVVWRQNGPISTTFRALDCSKLTGETGWTPTVDIEEGVARTARWWVSHQHTWNR